MSGRRPTQKVPGFHTADLDIESAVLALDVPRRTLVRAVTNACLYAPENSLAVAGAIQANSNLGRQRRLFIARRANATLRSAWKFNVDPPENEWRALRAILVKGLGSRKMKISTNAGGDTPQTGGVTKRHPLAVQIGKLYKDDETGIQLLVLKPGNCELKVGGRDMKLMSDLTTATAARGLSARMVANHTGLSKDMVGAYLDLALKQAGPAPLTVKSEFLLNQGSVMLRWPFVATRRDIHSDWTYDLEPRNSLQLLSSVETSTPPGWWSRKSGLAKAWLVMLGFIGLLFTYVLILDALGLSSDQGAPGAGSGGASSAAFKLAAIDANSKSPASDQVAAMASVLSRLGSKCPRDTETRLGDYLVNGQSILASRGKAMSIASLAGYVVGSIPASGYSGSCADVVAAFVTLTTRP